MIWSTLRRDWLACKSEWKALLNQDCSSLPKYIISACLFSQLVEKRIRLNAINKSRPALCTVQSNIIISPGVVTPSDAQSSSGTGRVTDVMKLYIRPLSCLTNDSLGWHWCCDTICFAEKGAHPGNWQSVVAWCNHSSYVLLNAYVLHCFGPCFCWLWIEFALKSIGVNKRIK